MSDLQQMAKRSAMLDGIASPLQTIDSRYGEGARKQYFANLTRLHAQAVGPLASNVYDAMCQGVSDSGDWYAWTPVQIRVSPAATSSTGENMPDDWMKLHVIKPASIDTVPPGAYLTFAGNTWIVYKGKNMGSVIGDGIIRRCNAVVNVLDWYGNIVSVPMSYAKMGTLGNANHASENSIVAKNYIACVCQYNEYSAQFHENTRLILGRSAYTMRGLNDYTREFTDEPDSVHMLTFTIERSEPLPQDSMEKQCADYNSFSWDLTVSGPTAMTAGQTAQLLVKSKRMGQTVVTSEEHPIDYVYSSNNPLVATVDENGVVTAKTPLIPSRNTATITVSLAQNPSVKQSYTLTVNGTGQRKTVFTSNIPTALGEYESATITAAVLWSDGTLTFPDSLQFSGARENCYGVEQLDTNTWRITCYAASNTPLTITAVAAIIAPSNYATATIQLVAGTTDDTDIYQHTAITGVAAVGTGF